VGTSFVRRHDLVQVGRGLLMGAADIIPGVSGGTVALILGIYERLVGAISRFDATFVRLLAQRRFAEAAVRVDLRFLVTLLLGIAIGIVGLASTMHWLLEQHATPTLAAFFGMILASSVLVVRMVPQWNIGLWSSLAIGAGFAFWLVGLPLLADPPDSLLWILFCGMVAICAMILPGISGAFILLILGEYHEITGVLRAVSSGDVEGRHVAVILTFVAGAASGLLAFSRVLRYLLARLREPTLAVLAGFMLGSLRKLWPFKTDVTPHVAEFKSKLFENRAPAFDTELWTALVAATVAGAAILLLDAAVTRRGLAPAATQA